VDFIIGNVRLDNGAKLLGVLKFSEAMNSIIQGTRKGGDASHEQKIYIV
jgi:hypothetical protein